MAKVCILGGGSWGIGLSVVLHKNGHEVTVWSAVPAEIQMLQEKHEHKMLPGVKLPEDMIFTTDDKQAIEGKDLLVMAVASSYQKHSTPHQPAGGTGTENCQCLQGNRGAYPDDPGADHRR